jgi:hypothetical protein
MRKTGWVEWAGLLLLLGLGSPLLRGQAVANAQMHGRITDPSGAVVPKAQIKATQVATGMTRTTVSNSDGTYILPGLPVGPYTLEVQAPGFSRYVQSGIVLQVGNNVALNVILKVGAVSQQVQVSANATMVQTQDTSMSEVVDQARIVDLPLNGRIPTSLMLLAGASTSYSATGNDFAGSKNYPNAVDYSVTGGQGNGNLYLMDGDVYNDSMTNVNLPYPFPDALQEFSVQTTGLSAQYGLHPGAVMNVVTKSGTNQFHGDLFEFVRNGAFDARNYFAATQDTLRQNQFGGTIGGPVKKNKLFAFFGYQGTRIRTAPPNTISYVPTAAVLNGDFSTLESAECQSDHTAATLPSPFVNNQISPSLYNAQALKLLKYIPVSSNPCGELIYGIEQAEDENQEIARVDWTVSSKQSVFTRYFITDYSEPPVFNGTNLLTTVDYGFLDRAQSVTIGDTYAISPTAMNSAYISWNRLRDDRGAPSNDIDVADLGVNDAQYNPHFIELAVNNFFDIGCGTCATGFFNRNSFELSDDVDLVRGKNTITFGADYIHNQFNNVNLYDGNGDWTFGGEYTGSPLADLMLGDLYQITQGAPQELYLRQNIIGLYAQDEVRLNSRLNFHVGLRWEPQLPISNEFPWQTQFSLADFESDTVSKEFTDAPAGLLFADDGISNYYNPSYADFEPRVGLVWDPTSSGKQTIRTSYSIFYDTPENFYPDRSTDEPPWSSDITLTDPVGGFTNPYLDYPGGDPFPEPSPPKSTFTFPSEGVYVTMPPNLYPTYMQQWDLSYERQLSPNWMVSATYIGNHTTHIWGEDEEDPAEFLTQAQCAAVGISAATCQTTESTDQRRRLYLLNPMQGAKISTMAYTWDGDDASYDALVLSAQHRFSQHYTILANYTYSHCLDYEDEVGEITGPGTIQDPFDPAANYGNCGFNLTHNIVVSLVANSPHFGNLWANRLLGYWQLSPIISYNSGEWFNATTNVDDSLTGVDNDRPDQVLANPYLRETNTNTHLWLNPAAYIPNALGTFGDVGRDSVEGPPYFDIDADLSRFFQMPWNEHQRLEVRFEFFNLGNNVNFDNPTSGLNSSQFGEITGANSERILQFALKYYF